MNLNAQSHFAQVPQVYNSRSQFDLGHSIKTSFDAGLLVPFYFEEVLPGDTFSIDTNLLCRMQPLVSPIMDDIYLDLFYFYVPNRLVWSHWKEFMGENTKSSWYPSTEYNVPHYTYDPETDNFNLPVGSIGDYFGVPVTLKDDNYPLKDLTVSKLPFRAYGLIWNEWFRDENLQDPVLVDIDEDGDSSLDHLIAEPPLPVSKYHDYFTSALPSPQKGPEVSIPLTGLAPVFTSSDRHDLSTSSIHFDSTIAVRRYALVNPSDDGVGVSLQGGGTSDYASSPYILRPDNLFASLENSSSVSINALRMALATQSFYELSARSGSRYRELIKANFGVSSPDSRQQVPELLSYNRVDININQVVQNSASTENSPIARQAAYALTADADNSFTKSFTEHGMVIGVCCARYKHSYQQGLNRKFSRRTMFDYYFPVFAHLGEQPILNKEIYCYSNDDSTNENVLNDVFGYQEAFAEYRYHPDIVTGEMRSGIQNSLDVWHLGDFYDYQPFLSDEWIREDKTNIDRALSVTSSVSNQFFADFYIENKAVRVMPMYSIPGLPRTL